MHIANGIHPNMQSVISVGLSTCTWLIPVSIILLCY